MNRHESKCTVRNMHNRMSGILLSKLLTSYGTYFSLYTCVYILHCMFSEYCIQYFYFQNPMYLQYAKRHISLVMLFHLVHAKSHKYDINYDIPFIIWQYLHDTIGNVTQNDVLCVFQWVISKEYNKH